MPTFHGVLGTGSQNLHVNSPLVPFARVRSVLSSASASICNMNTKSWVIPLTLTKIQTQATGSSEGHYEEQRSFPASEQHLTLRRQNWDCSHSPQVLEHYYRCWHQRERAREQMFSSASAHWWLRHFGHHEDGRKNGLINSGCERDQTLNTKPKCSRLSYSTRFACISRPFWIQASF